jgi:hypothetical protein
VFETLTAALVAIVFLVPGYVWRTVEGQFAYLDRRLEWEKFALGLLARSTVVYAVFAVGIHKAWKDDWLDVRPLSTTVVAILLIGVLPCILGFVSGMLRQKRFFAELIKKLGFRTFESHQIPTAWDYVFSGMTPRFAVITLKTGAKLNAFIGSESYFSSDPEARDFFISAVLRTSDNGIIEVVPGTAGVYVNKDEVSLIEFIKQVGPHE